MQRCYHAYTRGPCRQGEYLILPDNSVVPECQPNPCREDNYVLFRDGCFELDKPGPCIFPELPNVVGVNETTLKVICTKDYRAMNFTSRIDPGDEGNRTSTQINGSDSGSISSTMTTTPTISKSPDDYHPIVNGTKYIENRCFVGGIRWTRIKCPEQRLHFNYNYNYPHYSYNQYNNYPNPNNQFDINKKIQSIFDIPNSN